MVLSAAGHASAILFFDEADAPSAERRSACRSPAATGKIRRALFRVRELSVEPRPGPTPQPSDGRLRDRHGLRDLILSQAAEEP